MPNFIFPFTLRVPFSFLLRDDDDEEAPEEKSIDMSLTAHMNTNIAGNCLKKNVLHYFVSSNG